MPMDRGAEQGDVDCPLECSLGLGLVAAETRGRVAAQQASGSLPWMGFDDPSEMQRLHVARAVRLQEENSLEPTTQCTRCKKNGGLADLWYMDDGDIMCHPVLVPSYFHEFDDANTTVGAERTPQKTEVIYNVEDPNAVPHEWKSQRTCKCWGQGCVMAYSTNTQNILLCFFFFEI